MLPLRDLGICEYAAVWRGMREAVDAPTLREQIWTLEHFPVYTLGQSAVTADLLNPGDIPVVRSDRGGRATYHGPGQAVAYALLNLRPRRIAPRQLVAALQAAVAKLLQNEFALASETIPGQPGVHVRGAKIAALGIRIRHGRAYHGVSLNADCDLQPFQNINPCGFPNLPVARLVDLVGVGENQAACDSETVRKKLGEYIAAEICDKFPL